MTPLLPIGKIVTAASQQHAILLFHLRKRLGIGGVIFTPEIDFPQWSNEEKELLTHHDLIIHPDTNQLAKGCDLTSEWIKVAGNAPHQLAALLTKFNLSSSFQKVLFVKDDNLTETAHFDKEAEKGLLHFHMEGNGVKCFNPIGKAPLFIKALNAESLRSRIPCLDDFERLMRERKLEALTLQNRQALILDETVMHESNTGERFRCLAVEH